MIGRDTRMFTANVRCIIELVKVALRVTCLLCWMPGSHDLPVFSFKTLKE